MTLTPPTLTKKQVTFEPTVTDFAKALKGIKYIMAGGAPLGVGKMINFGDYDLFFETITEYQKALQAMKKSTYLMETDSQFASTYWIKGKQVQLVKPKETSTFKEILKQFDLVNSISFSLPPFTEVFYVDSDEIMIQTKKMTFGLIKRISKYSRGKGLKTDLINKEVFDFFLDYQNVPGAFASPEYEGMTKEEDLTPDEKTHIVSASMVVMCISSESFVDYCHKMEKEDLLLPLGLLSKNDIINLKYFKMKKYKTLRYLMYKNEPEKDKRFQSNLKFVSDRFPELVL